MTKFFNDVGKIFIGFLVFGILFSTSTTFAAKKNNSDAMKTFREMVMATSKVDGRIFHEDIYFVVPSLQSELDFIGKADGQDFKMAGDFNLWFTNSKGMSEDFEVPFYITQSGKDLNFYYKMEKEGWKKISVPNLAAALNDAILNPNQKELEERISEVKDVKILQDKESQVTMLVTLDGNKLADDFKKVFKEKSVTDKAANKVTALEKEIQKDFEKYLDSGFRNSNIWYVWTVDKKNNQTVSMSVHLSELIQQTAYAALNDKNQNNFIGIFSDWLETLAFYSEAKAYTTYLGEEAEKTLEPPQEALNAPEVKSIAKLEDVKQESVEQKVTK